MKKKKGFDLRDICGEKVIIATGIENVDFSNIITLNESAAYLWQALSADDEITAEALADLLCAEYEVPRETALADAADVIASWADCGIIA